ncbi:PHD finger protein EHD3-like isoform X2 [Abrus precatorius]|uniref:PHD finger protein EHD3-like isoform X2 n=1 Tax=Abrus precatorius TaxID=3816 RepID=A0A8B8JNH6_ABRPR|nr:PHD finger protein EHD3-like isoform X2 [Abrus precatorius]
MGTEDGTSNAGQDRPDRSLDFEAVNNGVAIESGSGGVEGEEVWVLKNEVINKGVVIADGNGVAVWVSKNKVINDGVTIADGNDIAKDEGIQGLKNEAVNIGVAVANPNGIAEGGELQALKNEAVNNEMVITDGNGVAKGAEGRCLKNKAVDNGVAIVHGFGVAEENTSAIECFRTYKRRKRVKSSSENKIQKDSREYVEAESHLSDQAVKKLYDLAVGNTSKDYSHGHWGNVVLKHLYHSLGNDNGGMEWCIREALISHPKTNCATMMMETSKIDKDGKACSSQFECLSLRLQSEADGHANFMHNEFSNGSDGRGATEKCQRVLSNVLASEKFSSLCKALLENFQGMKPESVFDFSAINSRMKGQAYEQSPTLFLSDVQQVWRNLQNTGNQIVAIAKSLSKMSKASFCEQMGISAPSPFEDEKQVESNSHMKLERTEECATYKIGICRHCGDKADWTNCLVCDSCEEMYHVSCIEPAVKEIPHKSWFCANCTASGIGSRHENCVVCEQLNVPKTLNNISGEESIPINEDTLHELEENSNCTYDRVEVSVGGKNSSDCKICKMEVNGEKIKVCGHPFCPNQYYHVRCLSSKQLKSYGSCWYCPSCLCQVCLIDKDDDKIVLCDGCDHAYHIYCMKPPRNSIPRGKWLCRRCDAGIQAIRKARKAHECNKWKAGVNDSKPNDSADKKWSNKQAREADKVGGMDMLLTAANTLNFEEDLNAIQIDSKRTLTFC